MRFNLRLRCIASINVHILTHIYRRWTQLLETFGGEEGVTCKSYRVETKTELEALLEDESFARTERIQLVEMIMPMHDAPRALKLQAELSGLTNKYV